MKDRPTDQQTEMRGQREVTLPKSLYLQGHRSQHPEAARAQQRPPRLGQEGPVHPG